MCQHSRCDSPLRRCCPQTSPRRRAANRRPSPSRIVGLAEALASPDTSRPVDRTLSTLAPTPPTQSEHGDKKENASTHPLFHVEQTLFGRGPDNECTAPREPCKFAGGNSPGSVSPISPTRSPAPATPNRVPRLQLLREQTAWHTVCSGRAHSVIIIRFLA
jgi:hypothetical protein